MRGPAAPISETPVFFAAGTETLFGVYSAPTFGAKRAAVVFLQGGEPMISAGRNGLFARIARQLARDGICTLRFDYHGVGDSTGLVRSFSFDEPFVEDLLGAVRTVEFFGADRIVLVATCFGCVTAVASAQALPSLSGLILLSCPAPDVAGGSTGPAFIEVLGRVARRCVPVVMACGTEDDSYRAVTDATHELRSVLADVAPWIEPVTLDGRLHGFVSTTIQDSVVALIRDRARQWFAPILEPKAATR